MWSQRAHMRFLDNFTCLINIWDHWIVRLNTLAKKCLSIRSIVASDHLLLDLALQSYSIGACNSVELLLIWNLVSTQLIVLRVLLLSSFKIILVNLLLVITLSAIEFIHLTLLRRIIVAIVSKSIYLILSHRILEAWINYLWEVSFSFNFLGVIDLRRCLLRCHWLVIYGSIFW